MIGGAERVSRPKWRTFRDRAHAGGELARWLFRWGGDDTLVVALPNGGVPVAWSVASALGAALDVWGVHKISVPWRPELTVGALAESGWVHIYEEVVRMVGLSDEILSSVVYFRQRQIIQRMSELRQGRAQPAIRDRTVVLVDDGVETGESMHAAITSLRLRRPTRIILAVPVVPRILRADLSRYVDEIVTMRSPARGAVLAQWYDDFRPVSDLDVQKLLNPERLDQPQHRSSHER